MAADYSQIELRIMAHLSGDASLLRAFAEDRDIHQATAAEVFGARARRRSRADQRRSAKAINFGLIYGMSAFGLARQLGIERGAAQQYVDLYFERYPGVKRYMDETRAQAREQGYVETVFGRRLYLPDIRSRNQQLRQYAERSAINAPMQGTAADIIKRAMISVHALAGERGRLPARLIMQVHDELVLEVRADAVGRGRGRAARAHGGGGGTARAAQGRHGQRRELGRGALNRLAAVQSHDGGAAPAAHHRSFIPCASTSLPASPRPSRSPACPRQRRTTASTSAAASARAASGRDRRHRLRLRRRPTAYKLIAGWRFLDWLAVEGDYVDFGSGEDKVAATRSRPT